MSKEKDPDEAVERDPTGKDIHEKGAKLDFGKPSGSLLEFFGRALTDVARLGTGGARKYTWGGWIEVGNGKQRYSDAMWRHLLKKNREEYDKDPELLKYLDAPILHQTQVAWNALAELELLLKEKEENGRQRDS